MLREMENGRRGSGGAIINRVDKLNENFTALKYPCLKHDPNLKQRHICHLYQKSSHREEKKRSQ